MMRWFAMIIQYFRHHPAAPIETEVPVIQDDPELRQITKENESVMRRLAIASGNTRSVADDAVQRVRDVR
jgi:hypothetical protein